MIAIIATFDVQPGKEEEFEAACRTLGEQVRANEPGNRAYQLGRGKKPPHAYRMIELYADMDALKLHGGTEYFKAGLARIQPLLAAEPGIELLEVVA